MIDSIFFSVAGGTALLLCILLVYHYEKLKHLLDEVWAVNTYEAKELSRLVKGGFDAIVKIQGTVTCDKPLISLASKQPCCWFRTTVLREVKRTQTVVDTDYRGRKRYHKETFYEWETEFSKSFSTVFKVHDQTGFTLVNPTNADIDTEVVYNETIHGRAPWFDSSIRRSDTGNYKIIEEIFASNGFAFVLGQASEVSGGVLIHYPSKGYLNPKKRFFIISRKTEELLTHSNRIALSVCFWFAVVAFLIALFCGACYFGLITR